MQKGFEGQDEDFSVKDIDDVAIASSIDKVFNDPEFNRYVSEVTEVIQNVPEDGRILESDLNDYIGKDNTDKLNAPNIPAEADSSQPIDDYYIAELDFKRSLGIYFALAREYKRLTGSNFTANSFKGQEGAKTSEADYGNLSGVQTLDEPKTIKGLKVDDDNLSAIDDNLIRIAGEIKAMIPMIEEKRMLQKTTPIVSNN